jgi:hypothetical protein
MTVEVVIVLPTAAARSARSATTPRIRPPSRVPAPTPPPTPAVP